MTLESLMVSALNLVCRRFINFNKGRNNFNVLTFGCPGHQICHFNSSYEENHVLYINF